MAMAERLDSAHQIAAKPRKAKDPLYPSRVRAIAVEVYCRIMERELPGWRRNVAPSIPPLTLNSRGQIYDKVVRECADIWGVEI